jgi:hypothetical protein
MSPLVDYPCTRRRNQDGTYDSICPTCFQFVAKSLSEAELVKTERFHNCPGAPLLHPGRRLPQL